jgi:hypothetical protein
MYRSKKNRLQIYTSPNKKFKKYTLDAIHKKPCSGFCLTRTVARLRAPSGFSGQQCREASSTEADKGDYGSASLCKAMCGWIGSARSSETESTQFGHGGAWQRWWRGGAERKRPVWWRNWRDSGGVEHRLGIDSLASTLLQYEIYGLSMTPEWWRHPWDYLVVPTGWREWDRSMDFSFLLLHFTQKVEVR